MTRSIYVVKSDPGPVKIGIAGKALRRISHLKTSSAYPLAVAYIGEAETGIEALEKRTHEILSDFRMAGEWFSASSEVAVAAVLQAAKELDIDLSDIDIAPAKPMTAPTSRMAKKRALQRAGLVYVAGWVRAEDSAPVLKMIEKVKPEVKAALLDDG